MYGSLDALILHNTRWAAHFKPAHFEHTLHTFAAPFDYVHSVTMSHRGLQRHPPLKLQLAHQVATRWRLWRRRVAFVWRRRRRRARWRKWLVRCLEHPHAATPLRRRAKGDPLLKLCLGAVRRLLVVGETKAVQLLLLEWLVWLVRVCHLMTGVNAGECIGTGDVGKRGLGVDGRTIKGLVDKSVDGGVLPAGPGAVRCAQYTHARSALAAKTSPLQALLGSWRH